MSEQRKITVVKGQKGATMSPDKTRLLNDKALQELEALECEVGRIHKRIKAVKEILKAA